MQQPQHVAVPSQLGTRPNVPIPIAFPPVGRPNISQPPTFGQPLVARPNVGRPNISQPPTFGQPLVARPNVAQPSVPAQPLVARPNVAQPSVPAQPMVVRPNVAQPSAPAQPMVARPNIAQPSVPAQPMVERPNVAQSSVPAQPMVARPNIPQPSAQLPISQPRVIVPQPPSLQQAPIQPTAPRTGVQNVQGGILRQFGGTTEVVTVTTTPQAIAAPIINTTIETGFSILTVLSVHWNGDNAKAQQLASLRYQNNQLIVDPARRDIITEIIGMLKINGFDDIIDFLTDAPNSEYILWDQSSMDEGRIKVAREILIQQADEVGVKGVGKCRYCGAIELVFATKQLRSGDEPATIFVRCIMCQKQWKE